MFNKYVLAAGFVFAGTIANSATLTGLVEANTQAASASDNYLSTSQNAPQDGRGVFANDPPNGTAMAESRVDASRNLAGVNTIISNSDPDDRKVLQATSRVGFSERYIASGSGRVLAALRLDGLFELETDLPDLSSFLRFAAIVDVITLGNVFADDALFGIAAGQPAVNIAHTIYVPFDVVDGQNVTLSYGLRTQVGSLDLAFGEILARSKWTSFFEFISDDGVMLSVNDGSTPPSAVPLPASLGMFSLGLGILGGISRRLKKTG